MRTKKKAKEPEIGPEDIAWYPAKDNPMFPKELTVLLRFGRTLKSLPCAYCGKNKRIRWTLLCPFKLVDWAKNVAAGAFEMQKEPTVFAPCTLVCQNHLLAPEIDEQAMMCGLTRVNNK